MAEGEENHIGTHERPTRKLRTSLGLESELANKYSGVISGETGGEGEEREAEGGAEITGPCLWTAAPRTWKSFPPSPCDLN